jgi:hypothetical protein
VELFGDLERLIDDLYPYRWLILAGLVAASAALIVFAVRHGVHRLLWSHKLATTLVAVPLLAVMLPVGYYTLSPLWTRTTLIEASPLVAASNGEAGIATATPHVVLKPTNTPAQTPTPVPTVTATPTEEPAGPTDTTDQPAPMATPEPTTTPEPTATPEPPPLPEPTPTPPPPFEPHVVRSGILSGADDFHFAQGTALLIEAEPGRYVLRLEDVSVRNGPDLFVYLSPAADGIVDGAVNLGALKATDGSFNYDVPVEYDVSQFAGVVIWCRAFAVLFGTAPFV